MLTKWHGSFTGASARTPGLPLLLNLPNSSDTLPEGWPRRSTFRVRERLPKTVSTFRRSVGYGVVGRKGEPADAGSS